MNIISFLKKWTLPTAIVTGISVYSIFSQIPGIHLVSDEIHQLISIVQPVLIFSMLFLTFCKIEFKAIRPRLWQFGIAAIQLGAAFLLSSLILIFQIQNPLYIEAAVLCFICPTATAAAVVTEKLGGNLSSTTAYILLINILTACSIPLLLPILYDNQDFTFLSLATTITGKVFPMLTFPLALAWVVRTVFPRFIVYINQFKNLAFYLWAVALSVAMGSTAESIANSTIGLSDLLIIAGISLVCCLFQFGTGKLIGKRYGEEISGGQAFGQKNTVFGIWLAYTFMTPTTSIAGGFYSIWHNLYNTYQINKKNRKET